MKGRYHNAGDIKELLAIMGELRDPHNGCPWDLEQDFASVAPYTLEEAYEVVDAIERNQPADLCDELGDLLFQVIFHAQMARELGWFEFHDVVAAICDKLIRRHPHVFADEQVENARQQTERWEQHKAREREARCEEYKSELDGVSLTLPALVRAQKIQRRASGVGFDWSETGEVLEKLQEELDELKEALQQRESIQRIGEELGDLMFSCVNLARFLDTDAESLLRAATGKFDRRFRKVEQLARQKNQNLAKLDMKALEELWQNAKKQCG